MVRVTGWIKMFRPVQWIKNGFVLAPLLFSGKATQIGAIASAAVAFAVFCLVASAAYILNDIVDRDADRSHPLKKKRPIASGTVPVRQAIVVAAVAAVAAFALALSVSRTVFLLMAVYLALNVLYSLRLKHVVILDVFTIAAFFLLRLLVGASAIDVEPSIWLLSSGGLLALYLGFAKRRHELLLLGGSAIDHRSVLHDYSPAFLDQMSVVLLSVTLVSYLMYTLTSDTAHRVGSNMLAYSIVFVLYGAFRYLYLVHHRNKGSPTETLLTDRALLVDVLIWMVYSGWVIYFGAASNVL